MGKPTVPQAPRCAEIGKPQRRYYVEPIEIPVPTRRQEPAVPVPAPSSPVPVEEPELEPERV